MRRALAILLVMLLVLPGLALGEAPISEITDEAMPEVALTAGGDAVPSDLSDIALLRVGTTTPLMGNFFVDALGTNTADMDVRALIHGMRTVNWTGQGQCRVNQAVVQSCEILENADGSHTYTIVLVDGLKYTDGSEIAASDFVFSALLLASPAFAAIAGPDGAMSRMAGYEAHQGGAPFSGVRLLDARTWALTVDARFLPDYHELALMDLAPFPIAEIAPGCAVRDDGEGAYIEGELTEALLRQTVMDEASGYIAHPKASGGPYRLAAYDREAGTAAFELSEHSAAVLPKRIELSFVAQADALNAVLLGQLDITNKITDGSVIEAAQALDDGALRTVVYPRSGLNFLGFACELGPTRRQSVRQAVAMCVDTPALIQTYLGGYGAPVYAYYGLGQWIAQQNLEALNALPKYELDLDAARALLEADGWTLDASGASYVSGTRYRQGEDGLEKLALRWALSTESGFSQVLRPMLAQNLTAAGFEVEVVELPFTEALRLFYAPGARDVHLFNLATNFGRVYDPADAFGLESVRNGTGIQDVPLSELAWAVRSTNAGDLDEYVRKWLAFQVGVAEVAPVVGLYSNLYFDLVRVGLDAYHPDQHQSWADAIIATAR